MSYDLGFGSQYALTLPMKSKENEKVEKKNTEKPISLFIQTPRTFQLFRLFTVYIGEKIRIDIKLTLQRLVDDRDASIIYMVNGERKREIPKCLFNFKAFQCKWNMDPQGKPEKR